MKWGDIADRFPRAARAVRWIDDTPERLHGWFGTCARISGEYIASTRVAGSPKVPAASSRIT